jgi:hypothetical protein
VTLENTFEKDCKDKIDYSVRWVDWLAGDQITGSSWTAAANNPDAALMLLSSSFTTGTTTAWFASGTINHTYRFDNHIGTLGGREQNRSILIEVVDR